MNYRNISHKSLIFRRLLPPPTISYYVNNKSHGFNHALSLLHQAFAFCGRAFAFLSILLVLPFASCSREDVPSEPPAQQLQVDTAWADTIYYNFDGEDEPHITLPDGIPEEGDAGDAV